MWFLKKKSESSVRLKSADVINKGIKSLFIGNKPDKQTIEELKNLLISIDTGYEIAEEMAAVAAKTRIDGKEADQISCLKKTLTEYVENLLSPVFEPLLLKEDHKPHIITICGINGVGKTTTVGKLANQYAQQGRKIVLGACDTFRAAATEQLAIWAERSGAHIIKSNNKGNPGSTAYNAVSYALEQKADLLILDTAGRIHTDTNLMNELTKINNIVKKVSGREQDNVIIVLDATTGRNVMKHIEYFNNYINLTGIIVTKTDGTAKAGSVLGIAKQYPNIKIHALGIGESIDDLKYITGGEFAAKLFNASE